MDKQIIIDGINVSKCIYFQQEDDEYTCGAEECNGSVVGCGACDNCYYKQLKRKEQECERLKEEIKIKTGKDYINEIQDITMKYECHQKSMGVCWWGKYGKDTECIGIRECHKRELEVIQKLEFDLKHEKEKVNELQSKLTTKEQECEELKKTVNEAQNSGLDLKSFLVCEAVQNEYEQQLDQLKAELEQYKKSKQASYEALQKKCNELELGIRKLQKQFGIEILYCKATGESTFRSTEILKLKRTLTEIKEIAVEYQKEYLVNNGVNLLCNKILNKISEVLDESN